MSNIILAEFDANETSVVTSPQYKWAKGQILKFSGLELPSAYRVNFSNAFHGQSKTQIGTDDGVIIPDVYFVSGKNIYAWIMLSTGDSDVEIEYDITIPILPAAEPEDDTPTEEQASVINQAIAKLGEAISALNASTKRVDGAVTKLETLAFEINEKGELKYSYDDNSTEGGE